MIQSTSAMATSAADNARVNRSLSDADYRKILTAEQYQVTRQKGTESPWSSKLLHVKGQGSFKCVCCGSELFTTAAKFDSGSGWPSFFEPAAHGAVAEHKDLSHGMLRTEVTCASCGAHLGHVFDDGPRDKTGLRYCVNGVALTYQPAGEAAASTSASGQPSQAKNS